jgi:hypothetical protein
VRLSLLPALALVACATQPDLADRYPDCAPVGTGGVVCASDPDVAPVAMGLGAWLESYSAEWQREDLELFLAGVVVDFADIDQDPECHCHDLGGCCAFDSIAGVSYCWVQAYGEDGLPGWYPETRLHHELTHAAERWIEGRTDWEHDDVPHRWEGGALLERASYLWGEMLSQAGLEPEGIDDAA